MNTFNKKFILRKKVTPIYTLTAIKNYTQPDFVEVLMGFCEDLLYRTADSLVFKPSVWLLKDGEHFRERYFIDDKKNKHYLKDFQAVGNGNPFSTVDLIMIESTAYNLEKQVQKSAKSQMLAGFPIEESYQCAFEYWTEW